MVCSRPRKSRLYDYTRLHCCPRYCCPLITGHSSENKTVPSLQCSDLSLTLLPPPFWSPGSTDMSVLQLASEGRRAHQVLPRLLLRVRENALRYATEEVPQMQRRLRGERLPPHLHRLKMFPLNCFFRRKGNGFQQ